MQTHQISMYYVPAFLLELYRYIKGDFYKGGGEEHRSCPQGARESTFSNSEWRGQKCCPSVVVRNGSGGESRLRDWVASNRARGCSWEVLSSAQRLASVGRLGRSDGAARGGLEIPARENFLGSWKDGKGSGKWRVMKKCAMKGESSIN